LPALKEAAAASSKKKIGGWEKDKVSFKFKEKGKKPINVSDVCQFMISGQDMSVDALAATLEGMGMQTLD
jgi:hypothetical protein